MKKAFLVFVLGLLLFVDSFCQTVNDIPIKDIDVEHIQIVGTGKLFSNKVTIEIDFGQENKAFSVKDTQLKDENGNLIVFNSMIDALNFMTKHGYEFLSAYALTMGSTNVYHYLLKKINDD